MRKGFLASALLFLPGAGLALAETPAPPLAASAPSGIVLTAEAPKPSAEKPTPGPTILPAPLAESGPNCSDEVPCFFPTKPVCGPPGRFWVSGEYLLWWVKEDHVPPLVTVGTTESLGVIGAEGTGVLAGGGGDLNNNPLSGVRVSAGAWLNDCHTAGIEASAFFLGTRTSNFTASGSGGPESPVIARPIFDVLLGQPNAELVAFPNELSGTVNVSSSTRLWGAEANALCNFYCCCTSRIDLLVGFRYLDLEEKIDIVETLSIDPSVPTIGGSTLTVADHFGTRNQFYGGQIGARAEFPRGRTFLNITGKIALGDTHETVDINGSTLITTPGGRQVSQTGGVLALPTNSGHFTRDEFAVVPEININVGYWVTPRLRAFIGYTFLYWSDVVRPGDQIDLAVNRTQISSITGPGTLVGPARPAFEFRTTDFWAQGLNVGLELRF